MPATASAWAVADPMAATEGGAALPCATCHVGLDAAGVGFPGHFLVKVRLHDGVVVRGDVLRRTIGRRHDQPLEPRGPERCQLGSGGGVGHDLDQRHHHRHRTSGLQQGDQFVGLLGGASDHHAATGQRAH